MMPSIKFLVARQDKPANLESSTLPPIMNTLLIVLAILIFVGLALAGALVFLRSMRKKKQPPLPPYSEGSTGANYKRLTISTTPSHVIQEKRSLMADTNSPPQSPVPEIRITFPEEQDHTGRRQSGRVVVVRVGEHSYGLEPVQENLPPYQQSERDRFQSLDLERMGGLKEKELERRYV